MRAFTRSISIFGIVAAILFAAPVLRAQQSDNALVVGTVLDPSRSPVQAATVKLTHLATDAPIQVHTDEHGHYRTPPVRIGEYAISVEAEGFKRFNQKGVVLNI